MYVKKILTVLIGLKIEQILTSNMVALAHLTIFHFQ